MCTVVLVKGSLMRYQFRSRRLATAAFATLAVVAGTVAAGTSPGASTGPNIELTAVIPSLQGKEGPAYTYVPNGLATFDLKTPPGTSLQWKRGAIGSCVAGRGAAGTTIGSATSATYTTGPLADSTDVFGSYFVEVSNTIDDATMSETSNCIDLLPSQFGPLPTPAPSIWAAGLNQSTFIALPNAAPANASFTAVASFGGQTVPVNVFVLPTTGTNGITGELDSSVTLWVPLPSDALGLVAVNVSWGGGPDGGVTVNTTIAPMANAGIGVVQDAVGSRNITVTAISPKFEGATLPADAYATGFHVFDADTGAWINPGRSGVLKSLESIGGNEFLRSVDPLVLPESALGRRIRVGFVTYYFPKGYKDSTSATVQYGALSDPISIQASGGGGGETPVPAPTSTPTPAATPQPQPTQNPAQTSLPPVAPDLGNPAQVTPNELAAIPPTQIGLIPPTQFGQIPPAAFAALTPAQVESLTTSQVNAIRPARAAQLTPQAVAALDPAQLAAMRPASVGALKPAALVALSPEQVSALRPAAIARIKPQDLARMSAQQLGALTPAQVRALTPEQRGALTAQQRRALQR